MKGKLTSYQCSITSLGLITKFIFLAGKVGTIHFFKVIAA